MTDDSATAPQRSDLIFACEHAWEVALRASDEALDHSDRRNLQLIDRCLALVAACRRLVHVVTHEPHRIRRRQLHVCLAACHGASEVGRLLGRRDLVVASLACSRACVALLDELDH